MHMFVRKAMLRNLAVGTHTWRVFRPPQLEVYWRLDTVNHVLFASCYLPFVGDAILKAFGPGEKGRGGGLHCNISSYHIRCFYEIPFMEQLFKRLHLLQVSKVVLRLGSAAV